MRGDIPLAPHRVKQFLVLLPGGEGGASCLRDCSPLLVLGGVPRLGVPDVLMERKFADGQGTHAAARTLTRPPGTPDMASSCRNSERQVTG